MTFPWGIVMKDRIVFKSHEPWRLEHITSASSHPELISGDFATPPRPYFPRAEITRSVAYDQRRAMGGMLALAAIAVLLSGIAFRSGATADPDTSRQNFARTCMQWHLATSDVLSRHVRGVHNVDFLHVSNSIDRMRRARRNCEVGQVAQACQDYRAVASSMPGHAMALDDLFACASVATFFD